ncbi:iron ABC transporter permease [Leucobacter weissii]|uniref:Iron ABC transporter permease n=1 Tax=Leucobacter weissii TaxID=1983706 RepID=A0A939MQ93_9MICO|nr:iron ABC transporter permease [Leucobacter weissii]MBO1902722.1 iron ABC transporter permease [Leucobacter weissii]
MSAPAVEAGVAAVRRPLGTRLIWLGVSLIALVLLTAVSISFGSREVSLQEILAALGGSSEGFGEAAVTNRLPRTALALLVGAALALAGAALQGVMRNPLADPGLLGINMGAELAVVVGIAGFGLWTATGLVWAAVLGAGVTAIVVSVIGSLGRSGATPLKLTLAGAATSMAFASFTTAVVLPRGDIVENVRSWQIGGVGGASWDTLVPVLPFLAVGALLCLASGRALNAIALGDELARGLGQNVWAARGLASLGAVLLAGGATALAGPIGFVGLVVPHLCRLLVGVDYRWLLPFSALVGAALLTGSDVVGRIVARPDEIDVGIITAIIGAPFFIAIVRRQKVKEL